MTFHPGQLVQVQPLDKDDPMADLHHKRVFRVVRSKVSAYGSINVLVSEIDNERVTYVFRDQDLRVVEEPEK